MKAENKIKQPLFLVLLVTIISYGISFIPVEGEIAGLELKQIDLFSDLKEEPALEFDDSFFEDWGDEADSTTTDENTIDEDQTSIGTSDNVSLASLSLFDNVIGITEDFINMENEKIEAYMKSPVQDTKKTKIVGNTKQMKYFFDALKNAKKEKVRIAHFGDSQIEGDLVTADLRETLRGKFGGTGAGYLALTSQDVSFRVTTKHEFPENKWLTGSVFDGNEHNLPYGMGGESFSPKKGGWVNFTAQKRYRSTSKFKEAYLIYSDASGSDVQYSFDKKGKQNLKLEKGKGIHQDELKSSGSARSIRLEFPNSEGTNFYGLFLEDGNGVYVDNFPLRGNSGEDLDKIPVNTLKSIGKLRDYKLVIFQFGKNAISGNYSRYEKGMVKVINNFQKALPNTSFLLLSVQDSGFKTSARMLNLLKAQMNIAKSANIAFWNLFEAMGGRNSMSKWVKNNPPLASADHTHFNLQGAKIVGSMLAEAILDLYNN